MSLCYAFKFIDGDGNPTGWAGMAYARNLKELFWVIDEFGDPYRCLIKPITSAGFCFLNEKLEISERLASDFDAEFKNPIWPDNIYD